VGFEGISRILSIPPVPPLCLDTTFVTSALPIMRNRRTLDHTPKPNKSRRGESSAIPPSNREDVSLTSHQRSVNLTINHDSEPQVNSYPASEQKISEVERGLICNAILLETARS
jgi:hypothetical protein